MKQPAFHPVPPWNQQLVTASENNSDLEKVNVPLLIKLPSITWLCWLSSQIPHVTFPSMSWLKWQYFQPVCYLRYVILGVCSVPHTTMWKPQMFSIGICLVKNLDTSHSSKKYIYSRGNSQECWYSPTSSRMSSVFHGLLPARVICLPDKA